MGQEVVAPNGTEPHGQRPGWRPEDATGDPAMIRESDEEVAEFKRAMNENRTAAGEPILFP